MALEHILEDLLADADKAGPDPDNPEKQAQVKIRLREGLHINLRKDGPHYTLILWRWGVHPSAREWNIVIAHWPYPLPPMAFHKGAYRKRHYLQGRVPGHPKITMLPQTWV